ncbi:MAG: DNA polymerase III subunit alpha, partial [Planctomycetes bacterium]|nr:DNA polymerase III subunit alpha [Planctomycetota bacterium]
EHVYELFGAERTALISTLNRFGLRAAFRETALAEGLPPAVVNRWSKLVPHYAPGAAKADFDGDVADRDPDGDGANDGSADRVSEAPPEPGVTNQERLAMERARAERRVGGGPDGVLELALRSSPEARGFPFDDERWARVLRHAERLLDAPRHHGLHPGGVVVAPGPITDVVACQRAAKGVVVTQFDKDAVEAIGLVKMDLLGNRALTVVDDCLRSLAARGVTPDLERIDENDPRTAALLREGRTIACFQVESPGMRNLLKQTGAADMDAVIQAVALIRPGPASSGMKDAYVRRFRGLEEPTPPHPRLVDLLCRTQGVMLYQEDVMQVAARMAGMDLAEADQLRRALKKRDAHRLEALAERFLEGCAGEGIPRAEAAPVWELIANFASFGFCKAHAVTYGRIAYRCAWLKAHHPADFLCAFLESDTGYYRTRVYVEEARRMGTPILGPDVNKSAEGFRLEEVAPGAVGLRIGLRSVKGITRKTLERILAERERAAFLSLPDFLERSGARTDECEALIQCGAFDAFDRTRPELSWRLHLLRTPQTRPPKD